MKIKLTKLTALWITLIFAALIAIIVSTGKAVANKPKTLNLKRKRGVAVSTLKTSVKKTPVKKASAETAAPKKSTAEKASSKKATKKPADESSAMKSILASTTGLKPNVLKLGLNAYKWAQKQGKVKRNLLTIVDFSIRSNHQRMWIINMNTDKVVMKTLVANGKGSGLDKGVRFSNRPGSLMSSLGVYVTGVHYYGNDGLSLHVHGLQAGINSRAYSRTIEFHGAWYVSPQFAAEHGRVGRSWGCFALDKAILPKVVKTIENGSVVFAYANGHSQDYAPYAS